MIRTAAKEPAKAAKEQRYIFHKWMRFDLKISFR
jgi:hypothetical protein